MAKQQWKPGNMLYPLPAVLFLGLSLERNIPLRKPIVNYLLK